MSDSASFSSFSDFNSVLYLRHSRVFLIFRINTFYDLASSPTCSVVSLRTSYSSNWVFNLPLKMVEERRGLT